MLGKAQRDNTISTMISARYLTGKSLTTLRDMFPLVDGQAGVVDSKDTQEEGIFSALIQNQPQNLHNC